MFRNTRPSKRQEDKESVHSAVLHDTLEFLKHDSKTTAGLTPPQRTVYMSSSYRQSQLYTYIVYSVILSVFECICQESSSTLFCNPDPGSTFAGLVSLSIQSRSDVFSWEEFGVYLHQFFFWLVANISKCNSNLHR